MSKDLTFYYAQRHAFDTIGKQTLSDGNKNNFYVNPAQITMPAFLIQEQPLSITTPIMTFSFGQRTQGATPILNNIVIGENDVAIIWGLQILIGYGATRNQRQYQAYGASVDDDVIYKSKLNMMFETNNLISDLETNIFRTENGTDQAQYDGAILINPQRTFTGRVSKVDLILDLGDISTLGFTTNTFVSVRLITGKGAAAAVK